MRRAGVGRLLAMVLAGALWGAQAATPGGEAPASVEAVIDLAPGYEKRSSLGIFPPTEVVSAEARRALGIKEVPEEALPPGLFIETRRGPDGAFVTQFGDDLFLTQRTREDSREPWTLRVPHGARGTLRVVAAALGESAVGLGVERPGEFARLEWTDGPWRLVLFDVSGGWGLDRLVELARAVR